MSDKVRSVKFSRQNGIHVSPTVLWDGLIANEISSSWGEKEWNQFLETKVQVWLGNDSQTKTNCCNCTNPCVYENDWLHYPYGAVKLGPFRYLKSKDYRWNPISWLSLLVQMAGSLLGHLDAGDLLLVRCRYYFFPIERRACLVVPEFVRYLKQSWALIIAGKRKKWWLYYSLSIFPAFSVPLHGSLILGHATNMYVAIFNKSNL